ncbi:MAG: indole-3-glycerol phosphate synthase TrpC [Methanobrevibacter sp.]|jgi:indole-3-glycerol phosphate synthase|nr:indole-3-glycerol phosphate synthase TrpC [Candidatus Methanovirga meridionalis]
MILDEIVKSCEERVRNKKIHLSFEDLKNKVDNKVDYNRDNSFEKSLKTKDLSFICEIKKASPSKGLICNDFNPIKIAKEYENAGASAISVLTEPQFFQGSDKYLLDVTNNVNLPVLRKDFVIDSYMIYEAKLLGASSILLITSILDSDELKKFIELSYKLDIHPLVETHNFNEIKIAINAGARIIGINNRNLKDFTVNIENSLNLVKRIQKISKDITIISESGIKNCEDIKLLNDNNIDGVLIGESLMRSDDKKLAINNLKSLIL